MSAQVISPRGRNDPKLKHGCNYAAKLLRRLGKRAETPASEIWRHCSLATRVRGWSVTRARSHHLCDVPTHCPQRKPRGTACPRANQAQPRRTELRAQLAPFAKPKRCFAMPPARFKIQILADAPSRFELENTDIPWPLRFAGALLISCTTSLRLIRGKRNTKKPGVLHSVREDNSLPSKQRQREDKVQRGYGGVRCDGICGAPKNRQPPHKGSLRDTKGVDESPRERKRRRIYRAFDPRMRSHLMCFFSMPGILNMLHLRNLKYNFSICRCWHVTQRRHRLHKNLNAGPIRKTATAHHHSKCQTTNTKQPKGCR